MEQEQRGPSSDAAVAKMTALTAAHSCERAAARITGWMAAGKRCSRRLQQQPSLLLRRRRLLVVTVAAAPSRDRPCRSGSAVDRDGPFSDAGRRLRVMLRQTRRMRLELGTLPVIRKRRPRLAVTSAATGAPVRPPTPQCGCGSGPGGEGTVITSGEMVSKSETDLSESLFNFNHWYCNPIFREFYKEIK